MGNPVYSSGTSGFPATLSGLVPELVPESKPAIAVSEPSATRKVVKRAEKAKQKEKDSTVETLRGMAIVCIVIGHVIGDNSHNGIAVEDGSIFRWWYESTRYLRMSMFFAISGYLYAQRPVVPGKFVEFARGKARLLVLPFVAAATLQFLLKAITPGVHVSTRLAGIWRIYVFGFDQFWFSQAAICAFATVLMLEKLVPLAHPYKWPVYLLLAILFELGGPHTTIFSICTFSAMLPTFFLGCLLYRLPRSSQGPLLPLTALAVFVVSSSIHQLVWFGRLTLSTDQFLAVVYGEQIGFIYLLFRFRCTIPWLALLGGFAYPIYLFHVLGTAGSRIALDRLGVHDRLVLFAIGALVGLALPIAIDLVFRRSLVLRRLFLGRR